MSGKGFIHLTDPDAQDVFLDTTNLPFEGDDVQEGFENLSFLTAVTSAPPLAWDRNGVVNQGTYLLNGSIPSNVTGRRVFLYNAELVYIYVSNSLSTTYTIDLILHNKVTYNTIASLTTTADYGTELYYTGFPLTRGWELATRVSPTSANKPSNVVVGVLMKGSLLST